MLNTPDQGTVHSIIQTLGRGIWSSTTTPAQLRDREALPA